jgi:hypothetical protein
LSRRIAVALFFLACAFRYLTLSALENDHFVLLSRAQQLLAGDWPVRNFEDPGQPLFYVVTAALASVFGHVLATNVILCIALQALAASLTFLLARRASGNDLVGIAAAAIVIISSPRLYNTTKVIFPVVTLLLQWRYADRQLLRRLVGLAIWTAVASLLRLDYAVYIVVSTTVLLLVLHGSDPREGVRRAMIYGVVTLACVAPWLLYVQWYEGIGEYAGAAIRFVQSEGRRTAGERPRAFYAFILLPLLALAVAFRKPRTLTPAHLASLAVLVLLINFVFLRDVLAARLPDVIAPSVVLVAALMGQAFPPSGLRAGGMALVAAAVTLGVVSLGIAGYRVPTPAAVMRQVARVTDRLVHVGPEIQPSPRYPALVSYLARCTAPSQRVFVEGFGPQVPFLAGRLFAGGLAAWEPGYYETPADVARAMRRLDREDVSAAVLIEGSRPFELSWPALATWFRAHGFEEHAVRGEDVMRVWLRDSTASPVDQATGLPCPTSVTNH